MVGNKNFPGCSSIVPGSKMYAYSQVLLLQEHLIAITCVDAPANLAMKQPDL